MMKNDKQMLDMLRNEFEKSSESVQVPLKLQKESMVAMLKNEEQNTSDFSVKTGMNKSNIIAIRRFAAAAAMFAVVIAAVLAMRADGVKIVKSDKFYKSYEGVELVKNAQSYEEIEKAVHEILGEKVPEKKPADSQSGEQPSSDKKNDEASEKKEILDKLYEGYRNANAAAGENAVSDETAQKNLGTAGSSGNVLYPAGNTVAETVTTIGDYDADIVDSNGEYLYVVTTGNNPQSGSMTEQIKIIKDASESEMKVVSTITLSDNVVAGASEECIAMHLKNNVLIAIMDKKDFDTETVTTAVYYDVSDPEAPKKIREHTQEGTYLFSTLNGNSLCLVTDKQIKSADATLLPSFTVNGKTTVTDPKEIFIVSKDLESSYIFITLTDISCFDEPVGHLAIIGSGKRLYCSESSITATREFVSVEPDKNGAYPSRTEIYRFNMNGSSIYFAGQYVVEGSIIGGVSVNGKNGCMTVATALTDSTAVYVFDVNMEFISGLKQIFPQKKADGVRFIGNKGYISSEGETMIIDFSSPKFPKVAGTISSKLFTGSLYEISETKLLGINTQADGTAAFRLFDVTDPENPSVSDEYTLDKNCKVLYPYDNRSTIIIPRKGMFGLPVLTQNSEKGTEVSAYALFDVSESTITPAGLCIHDESFVGDAAVRAAYNNGTVYTVSGQKTAAFNADTCEKKAECEIR